MDKIRYAVAGSGWRAMFYVRAAKLLPELFELTGVLCHTKESARAFERAHGVRCTDSLETLLRGRPEFVVSCVNKAGMARMVTRLLTAGMPALSETPLATDISTLRDVFEAQRRTGTALELAEQYFLYPTHQARRAIVARGLLGDVRSCSLSMMHDYHAVSVLRWYLGDEGGRVDVRARRITSPIAITGGRGGYVTDGQMGEETRTLAQLDYADGRVGLYDFSGTQYHSAIRSNHIRILGTRGEIFDDQALYLAPGNRPAQASLAVRRDRMTGTIRAIDFEGERLYENPFRCDVVMSEDDIAVCEVLRRVGASVRGGERHYPLTYAFRDAYLSCLMAGAADEDGRIHSVPMDWD